MRIRQDRGAGRPVLFVHAALGDATYWDEVVAVAPPGVRAISVDLPDFGYDAPATTIESLEASFREHVGSLGVVEPLTLVGHSFGAWVVARALATPPRSVRRAVLIGGLSMLPAEMASAFRQGADALASGALPRDAFTASVADSAFAGDDTPGLRERVAMTLGRYPDDRLLRALRLVAAIEPAARWVQPFDVPTVVVHGERDGSVPLALGERLASLGSRTELQIWPDVGHMLPLTQPERIARIVYG